MLNQQGSLFCFQYKCEAYLATPAGGEALFPPLQLSHVSHQSAMRRTEHLTSYFKSRAKPALQGRSKARMVRVKPTFPTKSRSACLILRCPSGNSSLPALFVPSQGSLSSPSGGTLCYGTDVLNWKERKQKQNAESERRGVTAKSERKRVGARLETGCPTLCTDVEMF